MFSSAHGRHSFSQILPVLPSPQLLQLIVVSLASHTALAGARITTSLYALSLHASAFTVGTLIALFSLFPMLLAVPMGRLIDRIGIMRPMLAGSFAIAIGCALPSMVSGLTILYLGTMLIGTGFMVIQVASQHSVGAMSSTETRAANFSWLALGFSISGFCGPVVAGFVIDHARFSASYMAFAACALGAFLLAAFGRLWQIVLAKQASEPHPGNALALVRHGQMGRIYVVGTLLSSAWDLFTFVLPIHGTQSGFSASTIGLILGCFSAATFVVRLAMPWIDRRFSEWQVLAGALALAAVCYALLPLTAEPLPLIAVSSFLGFAVGASQPNMLALLHHHAPPGRGAEAVVVRIMIGNACQVALPLAFGGAGTALGLLTVFWAMSLMIGAGVPLAWNRTSSYR